MDTSKFTKSNKEKKCEEHEGFTVIEAAMALQSAIIGAGMIGIPYAVLQMGLPLGIAINALVVVVNYFAGFLVLSSINMSAVYVESLYELGYVTVGSSAIYIIALLQFVSVSGLLVLYFSIFGDMLASIVQQVFY